MNKQELWSLKICFRDFKASQEQYKQTNGKSMLHWWLLNDNKEPEWPSVHIAGKTQNNFYRSMSKRKKSPCQSR